VSAVVFSTGESTRGDTGRHGGTQRDIGGCGGTQRDVEGHRGM